MQEQLLDRETELRLVTNAQQGDTRALEELLRAHRQRIWGVCRRIVGTDADAQDATQEASIAIMRHIGKFDGNAAFSTWVYRIATNASLDELRRRKRRPMATDDLLLEVTGSGPTSGPSHYTDAGFDGRIADRLQVDAALQKLPAEFRTAVVLRDLCDLDYAEIAEVLGIPIGTVRSRIARGRAALGPHLRPATEAAETDVTRTTPPPTAATATVHMGFMTTGTHSVGNQTGIVQRLNKHSDQSKQSDLPGPRTDPPSDSSHA